MDSIHWAWRAIRREAKLPTVRIHDLRHSYASMAASNGTPLAVIAKQLRHSSGRMSERYSHLYDDFVRRENTRTADSMAAAFGGLIMTGTAS
jgi:integrase